MVVLSVMLTFVLAGCGGTSPNDNLTPLSSGTASTTLPAGAPGSVAVTTSFNSSVATNSAAATVKSVTKGAPANSASVRVTLTLNSQVVIQTGLQNPTTFPRTGALTQTNILTPVSPGTYQCLVETLDINGNVTSVASQTVTVQSGQVATDIANSATVASVAVNPSAATVAAGATQQLTAIATLSNNSTADVTSSVSNTWSSSSTSVATVSNTVGSQGLVTGVAAGTATVTATYAGQSGSSTITVSGSAAPTPTPTPGPVPTPTPTPGPTPTPAPTSVTTTTSNTSAWKFTNNGIQFNASARKPGATSTGTYVYVGNNGVIWTSNDAQTTFNLRTSGTTQNLNGVIWVGPQANLATGSPGNAAGTFVAVGAGSTVLTSPDGITWTPVVFSGTIGTKLNGAGGITPTVLNAITFANNGAAGTGFMIVGANYQGLMANNGAILFTNNLASSAAYTDVSNNNTAGFVTSYSGVAYGKSEAANGCIYLISASTGGFNANGDNITQVINDNALPTNAWTASPTGGHFMNAVAFCNSGTQTVSQGVSWGSTNCFVMVGPSNWVAAAPSNTNFTGVVGAAYQLAAGAAPNNQNLTGVAFATIGGTDFAMIVGNIATHACIATVTTTFPAATGPIQGNWGNTGTVLLGATAFQGVTTGLSASATAPNPFTATAVGAGVLASATTIVQTGTNFTLNNYDPPVNMNGSVIGAVNSAPFFVTVGAGDANLLLPAIMTSTTVQSAPVGTQTWTEQIPTMLTAANNPLFAVTQGGAAGSLLFVAVGQNALATSANGTTWVGSAATALQHSTYTGVAFNPATPGVYLAVGGSWAATSAAGLTWAEVNAPTNFPGAANAVAAGNGIFVVVGNAGAIATSTNGTTFTAATVTGPNAGQNLQGVCYAGGTNWVAVGAAGTVATSSNNGAAWTTQSITANQLNSVAFISTANGSGSTATLVAVGLNGDIRVTTVAGGTSGWNAATSNTVANLFAVTASSITGTPTTNTTTNVTTTPITQFFESFGQFGGMLQSQ